MKARNAPPSQASSDLHKPGIEHIKDDARSLQLGRDMSNDQNLEELASRVPFCYPGVGFVIECCERVGMYPFGELGPGVDVASYDCKMRCC